MNTLTRRFIIMLLCCWLPLPGIAMAAIECHLLNPQVMTEHNNMASDNLKSEHGGCGGVSTAPSTTNSSTPNDLQLPCHHCQLSCHNVQLPLISTNFSNIALAPQQTPGYDMPQPGVVFIYAPQRPPQAA